MIKVSTKDPAHSTRIEWIDVAKGIGIFLVVLAHVLDGISFSGMTEPVFGRVVHFINTFHMPVFLVLAGVFAPRAIKKSSAIFWTDKLAGIVYPYFLWSGIQIGIQIFMARYTNTHMTWQDFFTVFYRPPMQFWFLYCLFLDFVIYRIIVSCGGNTKVFLLLSLLLSLVINFYNFDDTSVLGRMRDTLPFFAFGAVMSPLILRISLVPSWLLITVMIGGFGLTAAIFELNIAPKLLVVLSLPLLGIASVFSLATLLVRWRVNRILTYLGQMSLEIYLAQVLAYAGTRILLFRVFGITSVPIHFVSGLIVGLGLPILISVVARRCNFLYLFRWPIRSLRSIDSI
jgi:fucose 4-O-acetylase-like acetyltransferase